MTPILATCSSPRPMERTCRRQSAERLALWYHCRASTWFLVTGLSKVPMVWNRNHDLLLVSAASITASANKLLSNLLDGRKVTGRNGNTASPSISNFSGIGIRAEIGSITRVSLGFSHHPGSHPHLHHVPCLAEAVLISCSWHKFLNTEKTRPRLPLAAPSIYITYLPTYIHALLDDGLLICRRRSAYALPIRDSKFYNKSNHGNRTWVKCCAAPRQRPKKPQEIPSKSDRNLTAYTVSRQPCPVSMASCPRRPLRHFLGPLGLVFSSVSSFSSRPSTHAPFFGYAAVVESKLNTLLSCSRMIGAAYSLGIFGLVFCLLMCGDSRPCLRP